MVYEDREDEFMSMEEQDLYEPERYDELGDTFREQMPSEDDEAITSDEAATEDEAIVGTAEGSPSVEEGFGESINPDTNPHLEEQLNDKQLSEEAHQDYADED